MGASVQSAFSAAKGAFAEIRGLFGTSDLDSKNILHHYATATIPLPANWEWATVKLEDGRDVSCMVAHPLSGQKEKARVGWITGLNSTPLQDIDDVKKFTDAGITVCLMPLASPRDIPSFLQDTRERIRAFCNDRNSPLHKGHDPATPLTLITHSTSAAEFREMLDDGLINNPQGLNPILVNPFFDTAHSSKRFNPLLSRILDAEARLQPHTIADETLPGWLYRTLKHSDNAATDDPISTRAPQCKQITDLRDHMRAFVDKLERQDRDAIQTPYLTYVLGGKDPFACNRVSDFVARLTGSQVQFYKEGEHWPSNKGSDFINDMIERALKPQPATLMTYAAPVEQLDFAFAA